MRRSLPYLPLVMAVPAMWLLTEGTPAVRPLAGVAVAAVGVVGLRAALRLERAVWVDVVLCALLGLAATHVLLRAGFPRGHDVSYHLWGTYGYYRAIADGNPMPRWIHHLGVGMPLLLFYPTVPFLLMLPFLAAGMPTYDAFKYGFVVMSMASGASMFFAIWRWTGSRRAALVAAGAYCFAPHHLVHSNARTAVGEAAAMAVLPLFFYHVSQAIEAPSWRRARWAVLVTGLLALTHPLSLFLGGVGMGLWVLAHHKLRPGRPVAKSLGLLALLGLAGSFGFAGAYTLPIAVEGRHTVVRQSILSGKHSFYYHHGLELAQLVERRAWTHYQSSEQRGSEAERDEMPFYFGLILLGLIPLARCREHPHRVRGLLGVTIGALLLTQWPLDMLFSHASPMAMLQYPWRFLSVATFGACALVGFAVRRIDRDVAGRPRLARLVPGILFALIVLDCFPYMGAMEWVAPYRGLYGFEQDETPDPLPMRIEGLIYPPSDPSVDVSLVRQVYPQYFTHRTRERIRLSDSDGVRRRVGIGLTIDDLGAPRVISPAPYAEFRPAEGGPSRALPFTRGGGRIAVELPGEKGTLVIKEQWFPGWDAGRMTVRSTKDGLMRLDVEASDRQVSLSFGRTTWDRMLGLALSLLTVLALIATLKRR